jgi:hypothetical protein
MMEPGARAPGNPTHWNSEPQRGDTVPYAVDREIDAAPRGALDPQRIANQGLAPLTYNMPALRA